MKWTTMEDDKLPEAVPLAWGNLHIPVVQVIDLLVDAVCLVDEEGRYRYVSAAFERIFGYAPAEVMGRRMIDLVHPDDRERTLASAREVMAGRPSTHFENRYIRKDGSVVDIMWSARWSPRDRLRVALARDVTALKKAELKQASLYAIAEAAQSTDDLISLYRQIHEIVGRLLPAHNLYVAMYDRERDELTFPYHVDERDEAPPPQPLQEASFTARVVRGAEPLLITQEAQETVGRGLGHPAMDWLGVPLTTAGGVIGALVVQSYRGDVRYSASDMELLQFVSGQVASAIARKQLDLRLHHSALHDPLTDLPNRELLQQRLDMLRDRADVARSSVALLYIDLDNFKQINDSLGHAIGDALLRSMAERLGACVRRSDTVARVGGDEFVIVLTEVESREAVAARAGKLLAAIAEPFQLDGHAVSVTGSIGSVTGEPGRGRLERLLNEADQAMYRAKSKGGNRIEDASLPGT